MRYARSKHHLNPMFKTSRISEFKFHTVARMTEGLTVVSSVQNVTWLCA